MKVKTFSIWMSEAANGMLNPNSLVTIAPTGQTTSQFKLNKDAAQAYNDMKAAAEADGISWGISDSYRDYDQQVDVAQKKGLYNSGGLAAVPGTSNHGWGSALDLELNPAAQAWLQANASKFGFTNIPKEPWHWEHKSSADAAKAAPGDSIGSDHTVLIDSNLVTRLMNALREKGFKQSDLDLYTKRTDATLDKNSKFFTTVDLSTNSGIDKYAQICQAWINKRNPSSPIKGEMLAAGAAEAFKKYGKYVPPQLALAQLTQEGGLSTDQNTRPIKTKNPFNVGNVDTGANVYNNDWQAGINAYYNLIAKNYLSAKTADELVTQSFTNKDNQRYATPSNYEASILQMINSINSQILYQLPDNSGNVSTI